jgi:hypothetical protein
VSGKKDTVEPVSEADGQGALTWRLPTWSLGEHARPYLILLVVHGATAALFLFNRAAGTDAALTGLPLDDSWIHLVYARSLAALQGFAYNPGQLETGFTSPLWVVLCAPLFWLKSLWGGDVVYGVKALGLALGWANSALAWRLALRLSGARASAYAAALLLAVEPSLCFAKLSGMEILCASALMLYGVWSLTEGRLLGVSVAIALAPLARPESLVYSLLLGAALLMSCRGAAQGTRRALLALSPLVLTLGLWAGYCLLVTGRPLPSTYYAKHMARPLLVHWPTLELLVRHMLLELPTMYLGSGLFLYALGALVMCQGARDRVALVLLLTLPWILLCALSRTHHLAQAAPFYWHRYFEPIIPLVLVPVGVALGGLAVRARDALSRRQLVLPVGTAVLGLLCLVRVPGGLFAKADLFSENCENINEMNVAIGRWLRSHAAPDDWIATHDAGAIRFFSERRVLDLVGLNEHRVLAGQRSALLAERRPRYYVSFPPLPGEMVAAGQRVMPVYAVRARRYTICDCDQEELVVYRSED